MSFSYPWEITYHNGFLYVGEWPGTIREINVNTQAVITVAGQAGARVILDGNGLLATFKYIQAMEMGSGDNLYIADDSVVRVFNITSRQVSTILGKVGISEYKLGYADSTTTMERTAGLAYDPGSSGTDRLFLFGASSLIELDKVKALGPQRP